MSRVGDVARPLRSNDIRMADLVELLGFLLNVLNCEAFAGAAGEVVLKQRPYVSYGEVRLIRVLDLPDDLRHRTLKLPNIRA